jgi:hypothetical protein
MKIFGREMSFAREGRLSALFLVIALLAFGVVFVGMQWSLVLDPVLFIVLVLVLVLIAFWSSATEAAFAIAPTRSDISTAIENDLLKEAEKLVPIDKAITERGGSHELTAAEERTRTKILREIGRIRKKK